MTAVNRAATDLIKLGTVYFSFLFILKCSVCLLVLTLGFFFLLTQKKVNFVGMMAYASIPST